MLRLTRSRPVDRPVASAAIARARLMRALDAERPRPAPRPAGALGLTPPPADDLLGRLLHEPPAADGRAS